MAKKHKLAAKQDTENCKPVRVLGPYCDSPSTYRLVIAEDGKKRSVCFKTAEEAEDLKNKLIRHEEQAKAKTIGELVDLWLDFQDSVRGQKQSTSEYLALQLKGWLPIRALATSISEATARALYAALVEQVSPRTKRIWTHYYNAQVRTLCRRAGVPEVVPHSLRGFDATLALEGGATADAVAKALGHSSFAMTEQHYASPSSVSNSRSSRVAQTLGGVGKWFSELLNLLSEIDLQNLLTELQTRGARKETSVGDDAT